MAAGGGRPGEGQAQRGGRLGRLDVQVVPDLHVVGHEPDRDRHHGIRPGLGQLTQVIADVGFQPCLGGQAAPALVGQRPRVRASTDPFGN